MSQKPSKWKDGSILSRAAETDNFSYIGNTSLVGPDSVEVGQRCPSTAEIKWCRSRQNYLQASSTLTHHSSFFNFSSSSNAHLPAFLIYLILLRNRKRSGITYLHFSTNWPIFSTLVTCTSDLPLMGSNFRYKGRLCLPLPEDSLV